MGRGVDPWRPPTSSPPCSRRLTGSPSCERRCTSNGLSSPVSVHHHKLRNLLKALAHFHDDLRREDYRRMICVKSRAALPTAHASFLREWRLR